jgi:hypothetical protein
MRNLTIADLKLALRNLLGERKADLLLSGAGKLYEKQLAARLKDIEALPEALTGGRPLAADLAETDETHDSLGEALFYYGEAILRLPTAPADVKAAAQRIRDTFVPRLGVLRDSYADEAAAAAKNRRALAELKSELEAMPVPVPTGGTLLDWATAFVDCGDKLDKLLDARSLTGTGLLPAQVIQLRTTTIGVLGRFRGALADELAVEAELPRDLDMRVFSYIDQLQAMRLAQARAGKRSKGEEGSEAAPTEDKPTGG